MPCGCSFNPPNFVAGSFNGGAVPGVDSPLRSPEHTQHLYEIERPIRYSVGTCVLYRCAFAQVSAYAQANPEQLD